jgi:NADH-quinone oxidoreductase subunit D
MKMPYANIDLPQHLIQEEWVNPYLDIDQYESNGDLLTINMGPQHPSTHGVLRLKLWMDGEQCIKATPYLGYLHRGKEKLCETLSFVQITAIIDKVDYVSPMLNEIAINMAFEKLLEIEIPPRAVYMRTILAELQRIASHLLWLGTFGLDLGGALGGGASVFLHCFRERELILDCFEALTGSRFHYNTHTVGGNRHDFPQHWDQQVISALKRIENRIPEYQSMLYDNPIFIARTKGVGVLDPRLALELGVSGPNLRASGVSFDLRKNDPYLLYPQLDFKVITSQRGDCLGRYEVRVLEIKESIAMLKQLFSGFPTHENTAICALRPVNAPTSSRSKQWHSCYQSIESARGELGAYVISAPKAIAPYRCKIRPPSFIAVSALPYLCAGANLSDIVVILGSLDPIMGEVDR